MMLGDLDSYMQKQKEAWPPTYTIHKNKFKMDKTLKYKSRCYQSPRGEHRQENLRYSMQQYFHQYVPKGKGRKGKNKKWDFIKIKSIYTAKKKSANWRGNQPYGKIYLQMIPQTRVWSPKYIKNSHDSNSGRQITQLKNGQRTWIDSSPKRSYRGPRDIWKDTQHH